MSNWTVNNWLWFINVAIYAGSIAATVRIAWGSRTCFSFSSQHGNPTLQYRTALKCLATLLLAPVLVLLVQQAAGVIY